MLKLKPLGANQAELSVGDALVLFSYQTPVAAWVPGQGWIRTATRYSQTTSRHINRWLGGAGTVVPQSVIDGLLQQG